MSFRNVLILCLITCCLISFMEREPAQKIDFSWLEGRWVMQQKNGSMGESWTKGKDDAWMAKSFYTKATDTSYYETVVLAKHEGQWTYTVTAVGQNDQKPVMFKLTSSSQQTYMFENPEHDFPKRIIYRHINQDSIHASIDAGADHAGRKMNFYYKRHK